jgi:hypothetical protein
MKCVKRLGIRSRRLQSSDQGAHIQAAENFAEPVGLFLRRRNEVTTCEGLFMIAPALKEEERPALTDTTGLWDRGNPTMAGWGAKRKATRGRSFGRYRLLLRRTVVVSQTKQGCQGRSCLAKRHKSPPGTKQVSGPTRLRNSRPTHSATGGFFRAKSAPVTN